MIAKLVSDQAHQGLVNVLALTALISINLGLLNLLPIPPLDGSKVLEYFLPPALYYSYKRIEPYSFLILILFIATPLLEWTLLPIVTLITRLLL
jgi:Zn-dependent protease